MKVRDVMTRNVIRIGALEPVEVAARTLTHYNIGVLPVEVAARTLTHYNIGVLPVCGGNGELCGVVTDRDLVTRCMASGRDPGQLKVRDVMTSRLVTAGPDMDAGVAAHLMGREQVRRLPVVENGKLCGVVSLADLAQTEDLSWDAADALAEISTNICRK